MSKIPFADQILPTDYLLSAQTNIEAGKPVSGEDLLLAIEQSIQQQLPETVRNIVRRAIIPAVKTRGRPSKFGASLDLALEKVDQRYPALLRYEKRKKHDLLQSGKAALKGDSSSMFAYGRLLQHMKDDFGPMTWEALRPRAKAEGIGLDLRSIGKLQNISHRRRQSAVATATRCLYRSAR
jgi:hypothetical protein